MAAENVNFIYLSEILNLQVIRDDNKTKIGKVIDLAASTGQVYPKITGIIVHGHLAQKPVYIAWSCVRKASYKKFISVDYNPTEILPTIKASEHEILLRKTFLDRQIISTSGSKVVRVNDLQLLIENYAKDFSNLWLVHIDIGVKGLLRRLGFFGPINAAFKFVVDRDIRDKFVSWKHVSTVATTNVFGSVQLKTDSSKLSEIHPADLADIMEDLGIEDRLSLIESLDYATAAATLIELQENSLVTTAEEMDIVKLAHIVREMPLDKVVDLLEDLSPRRRQELHATLPPELLAELKELTQLSAFSIGSIMSTDYIAARPNESVELVLRRVTSECTKVDLYRYVYIVDDTEKLVGVVSLRELLSGAPRTPLSEIMSTNLVSIEVETRIKHAANVFIKYNFEAVPVIDEERRLQGVVRMRDALETVFPKLKEEATV
jgi:CBS domain-containing protein/sporulation protein YlmC with PRC-barrel domain